MLQKFIQLVELQALAHALMQEIEANSDAQICALDNVQLLTSAQTLFDEFCECMSLVPKIEVYPFNGEISRTQEVNYKGLRVFVHESNYVENAVTPGELERAV